MASKVTTRARRAASRALRGASPAVTDAQADERVRLPVPMTPLNIARYCYFERFFRQIEDIEGDVVECGVGRGDSLIILSILAHREGRGRRVWGFDSFEGFPEPTPEDHSARDAKQGQLRYDIDLVIERLRASGFDDHFVNRQATLVKGYFEESLQLFRGKQIALLHLDCDLYQSYRTCLETLYPLVPPGGLVAFDEYVNTGQLISFPGAQKAIDEFLGDDHGLIVSDRETGQYYLTKPG